MMYLKTAIILSCFAAFYMALVFYVNTLWQGLPLSILLALSTVMIGFNIQHNAGCGGSAPPIEPDAVSASCHAHISGSASKHITNKGRFSGAEKRPCFFGCGVSSGSLT